MTRGGRRLGTALIMLSLCLSLLIGGGGVRAAAAFFTITTEHFAVHFPDGQEEMARRAAGIAEEVYPALTREVGYVPPKRTQLVLTDYTDLANGSASVSYDPTITIYLAVPSIASGYDSGFGGNEDWLRYVITHEYAHILHLDMHQGYPKVVRSLLGNVPVLATPNEIMPMAFIEGFAVLEETRNTRGGRGGAPYYEMFLRTAALDGRLFRMDRALGLYWLEEWSPTVNVYLYGYGLWGYIVERFGPEKAQALNAEFSSGRYLGISFAVRKVLGVDLAVLWRDWQVQMTARYRRQAEELAAQGLTRTRPLTSGGFYHQASAYSPDGTMLAYIAQGPSVRTAVRIRRRTGEDEQLVAGAVTDNSRLAWSPDSATIAYGRLEYNNRAEVRSDLYIYDVKGRREIRLTTGQRASDPAWSPDGREIAYVSMESGRTLLSVINLESGALRRLAAGSGLAQFGSPAWRPDGRALAVSYKGEGGNWDLVLVDAATGMMRTFWQDEAIDRNPAWSRDGRHLFFDSDRSGITNVYALEVSTGRVFRVTNVLTGAFDPEPSPDGASLAFMLYSSDGYDIHQVDLDESRWVKVDQAGQEGEGLGLASLPDEDIKEDTATSYAPGAAYTAQPYKAWETLRPKFWLPVPYLAGKRLAPAVITSGQDALARALYTAQLRYDPRVGGLAGSLNLAYRPNQGAPRMAIGCERGAGSRVSAGAGHDTDVRKGEASLTWDYPRVASYMGITLLGQVSEEKLLDDNQTFRKSEAAVQVDLSRDGGRDDKTWRRVLAARLARQIQGDTFGTALLSGVAQSWRVNSIPRVYVAANAGICEGADGLSLGDGDDTFYLRGLPAEYSRGDKGVSVTLEAVPLHLRPEIGYNDVPVFLNQVQGVAFIDLGAIRSDRGTATAATLGWEMRSRVDLVYGMAPLSLKGGVAVPLDGKSDPTLYFGWALALDIPGQAQGRNSGRK